MKAAQSIIGTSQISISPQKKGKSALDNYTTNNETINHIRRDTLSIKVDDFLSVGRPLWSRELTKCNPGPANYLVKSPLEVVTEKSAHKPNKCLFGESHEKYKKVNIIFLTY